MKNKTPAATTTDNNPTEKGGLHFAIPTIPPGLLATVTIIPGLLVLGLVIATGVGGVAVTVAAAAAAGVIVATEGLSGKYNSRKVLSGILGGSAFGAALTYGVAVKAPQAPAPVEKPLPPLTLRIEPQGGGLCRDFKLTEKTATADINVKGQKTDPLTVPAGCNPAP